MRLTPGARRAAAESVGPVDFALGWLVKRLSTRSVRLARMILIQAGRNARHPHRRSKLRLVTRTAAIALGPLFESRAKTDGGQS